MKRRLVFLYFLVVAFILTGCHPKDAMCNPDHVFKIGMITDGGGIDDRSFNQGTWEGSYGSDVPMNFAKERGIVTFSQRLMRNSLLIYLL